MNKAVKTESGSMSEKDFKLFKPLIKGIDKSSKMALLGNSIVIIRRIIFLYVVMFKYDNPLA